MLSTLFVSALAMVGVQERPKSLLMTGVAVAPCPDDKCGGGNMIRVVPQHIKQYRQAIGSADKDMEPYLTLSEQDRKALGQLSSAILDRTADVAKAARFSSLLVERNRVPSSFNELREAVGPICDSSEMFSLTDKEDKTETYAVLAFNCSSGGGERRPILVGIASRDGRPIRAYLEETEVVSAPLPASAAKIESH